MALGSTGAHEVWVKLMISHQGPTPLTEIPLAGKRFPHPPSALEGEVFSVVSLRFKLLEREGCI